MDENCRQSQYERGEWPWHDGRFCGPTDFEDECACGCTAYDELCDFEKYSSSELIADFDLDNPGYSLMNREPL